MPRPRLKPTEDQRRMVKSMAAMGIRQDQIAMKLGIRSPKTLSAHFREELDRGETDANYNVANALYNQAISGSTAAAIFWMKTRARWRERAVPEYATAEPPPFVVALENGGKS
ncbi:MAG: hypothetical protein ABSG41_29435 [Bryobacteraceae bacterium]|jgi:hypothetical protein